LWQPFFALLQVGFDIFFISTVLVDSVTSLSPIVVVNCSQDQSFASALFGFFCCCGGFFALDPSIPVIDPSFSDLADIPIQQVSPSNFPTLATSGTSEVTTTTLTLPASPPEFPVFNQTIRSNFPQNLAEHVALSNLPTPAPTPAPATPQFNVPQSPVAQHVEAAGR
jgi:hypothetical protein